MGNRVKISKEQIKKGILKEIEISGLYFDGMEEGDTAVFYIRNLSYDFVDGIQKNIKEATRENLSDIVKAAMVDVLVDETGEKLFNDPSDLSFTLFSALFDPVLEKAFDLRFKATEENSQEEIKVKKDESSGVGSSESSDLPYGPNGSDPSAENDTNPFSETIENNSSIP